MRIEKLSDKQVKITLNQYDLMEKEITLNELVSGSPNVKKVIDELLIKAISEFDINTSGLFVKLDLTNNQEDDVVMLFTFIKNPAEIFGAGGRQHMDQVEVKPYSTKTKKEPKLMFEFEDLNLIAQVSRYISKYTFSQETVYKYKNKYYLDLRKRSMSSYDKIEAILSEFGNSVSPSLYTMVVEHGEYLIKENAIKILIQYF